MGKGLLLASTFCSGLGIFLGAKQGYINQHIALVALVVWVLVIRHIGQPSTEDLADEVSREHQRQQAKKTT
ncbi:hypothetical protein ACKKBG_A25750 [Auxenochlorella protothecoides x Auxenochlorella symbiontica]